MPVMGTSTIDISADDINGTAVSIPNDVNFDSMSVVIPSAWTAADMKFQFSLDGGTTWVDFTVNGTVQKITSIPTAQSEIMAIPATVVSVVNQLPNSQFRVVSIDTADETDEAQAADRAVIVLYANPTLAILQPRGGLSVSSG